MIQVATAKPTWRQFMAENLVGLQSQLYIIYYPKSHFAMQQSRQVPFLNEFDSESDEKQTLNWHELTRVQVLTDTMSMRLWAADFIKITGWVM